MPEDWWPDWRGETVVIAASGPSQCQEDIDYARGKARVVAINNTWLLCPWADVLYACDRGWWERYEPGYGRDAVAEFPGMKVSGSQTPWTHKIGIRVVNEMLWTGQEIGGGGNSAFQAVNFSALWGAKRIILTGCDCMEAGEHWHGKHPIPLAQTKAETQRDWIAAFTKVAPALTKRGIEVINSTRRTALTCFAQIPIREVL